MEFPVYAASLILTGEHWDKICNIEFSLNGSFINNPQIKDEQIPKVLDLFASFVSFDTYVKSSEMKNLFQERHADVFDALPTLFINFAQKCRTDHGYCLLRRMLRHAYDSRTESLDNKNASLVLSDGKVGIHLKNPNTCINEERCLRW